ncbi:aspartate aminotransferase family protein [Marinobacterium mangrovicola]|uniref:Acetylornithine aminotransferase n=1 Tax=Marinobacterium mangrovicola TaxID=1476959 RepID=A0A4R1GJ63_9GAMM|nr:aspartate aminotransferase family protein [Marinobacterium mangrovicola]TCK08407.1 acetylornithine/N-succinyldiaminopimelate aminotransferase [Marinobacterium mangrovicola]
MSDQISRATFDQVMVPCYAPADLIPVRGEGSRLWDQQGREYVDLAGGIAVNCLGHRHPALMQALQEQADRVWHLSNVFTNEPALALANRLTELTFAEQVFFANSGAEANEAAFKLARKYAYDHAGHDSGKHEIISFNGSFHGRTLFTVSVGGQLKYRQGFEPVPAGITHLPYNDVAALERAVSDKTCAVVMEPVLGEGGVIPAKAEFAQLARTLCDRHNALLIFDEVQTGAGRTGALYAYQELGVTPDILTSAKGLGGGFPIGAMLTSRKVAASFGVGTHGTTYGGNPLACAVALAVMNTLDDPELMAGVKRKSELFRSELNALNLRHGFFSEIRGSGLLLGAELSHTWKGQARRVLEATRNQGLMLLMAGPDVIRLTPSLIIPDADIQEAITRFDRALDDLVAEGPTGS